MSPLSSYLSAAEQSFWRYPLVVSGERSWCLNFLVDNQAALEAVNGLYIGDGCPLPAYTQLSAGKVKSQLGGEHQLVIWDGFAGISPDGLGAIAGTIKGGGLLVLLLPPLDVLACTPDPDYLRICSDPSELDSVSTFFLQRLVKQCFSSSCLLVQQDQALPDLVVSTPAKAITPTLPNDEQKLAIEAISHVVEGHRRRPLVITADRGRGKSSALGIAAAKLILKRKEPILLTAPSKGACQMALLHFSQYLKAQALCENDLEVCLTLLHFIAPDELLASLPKCQLLLVDEAAAIPTAMLNELLAHYSRIVFSTTVHGYEGNGQGFALRFKKQLQQQTPQWKELKLTQAVRWADNDPLEQWLGELLLLSCSSPVLRPLADVQYSGDKLQVSWPSQQTLAQDTPEFEQLISLLVNAHYQTSPDDLRFILDHPRVHVGICKALGDSQTTLAAMLLIEEGGIQDDALCKQILYGKRRLRGHIVPQTLATYAANTSLLKQKTLRVIRIAVRTELQHLGIGSHLLSQGCSKAEALGMDSISTSYGLTNELLRFWYKNGFHLQKLGTQRDNASGSYAAVMMQSISKQASTQQEINQSLFADTLLSGLPRQYREVPALIIKEVLTYVDVKPHSSISSRTIELARQFAEQHRSLEDGQIELLSLIFTHLRGNSTILLSDAEWCLLTRRIVQGRSQSTCVREFKLTGKKALDKALRLAVKKLLAVGVIDT